MTIFASVIVFIIIQKLNNRGKARGVKDIPLGNYNVNGELVESKERIVDIPFILIIVVYILTMLLLSR